MFSNFINYGSEVGQAFEKHTPVVALESTIITHGMPYPENLNTAIAVEDIVRNAGATPATIAIINGEIKVGLEKEELESLAKNDKVFKASERDIPLVLTKKASAGTTVSATLAISAAAGIRVFATGGIGGVGPDAYKSFDISADILSIGRYPCITVCAGAKAFMDISATLESFETNSIPVLVYQSDHFPLFYSRDSGIKVDWTVQTPEEAAEIFITKLSLGQNGGLLVAVPIPEKDGIPEEEILKAVSQAVGQAAKNGISGKEFTPYVLSRIKDVTDGRSLVANVALIKHNALIGSQIAKAVLVIENTG